MSQQYNLANATITSNYVGKQALPYVAPAILAADTIANNYVTVLNNVRGRAQLRKFSGSQIQAATCTFTTGTALALEDVALSTTDLQINDQICNKDLHMAWESEQMVGASATAPADMKAAAGQYVAKRAAEAIEFNIWQGNYNIDAGTATGATYTLYNGLLRQMVLASPTYEANLTASLSAANILSKLLALTTTQCPPALKGDPNATIYMSRGTRQLYFSALAGTAELAFFAEGMADKYAGYRVVAPAGFPDDTLLISRPENLYVGTNLLTDLTEARVLDLIDVTGDDVTRVIMKFAFGTQVVDHDSYGLLRRTS
jgi:hypothetical protein